ncbi:M23 family metallopeptidase [Daejeonella sp.]|uniref:M23 family metallopeptidase n=1 Tax=Daejeonella sp. TaxID=2805397 RepID=UPI0030C624F2
MKQIKLKALLMIASSSLFIYSSCKPEKIEPPETIVESNKKQVSTLSLNENAVSTAAANVYSTAAGTNVIGSIGVNENLEAGNTSGSRTFVTYRTSGADKSGWATSSAVKLTTWMWPVQVMNTTQDFNDYSSSRNGYHLAIDMTSSLDLDAIYAAHVGTVVYAGYSSGNGNHVIIQHNNGDKPTVFTLYCHMSSLDQSIVNGYQIAKGEKIGVMGCTGSCTGKHLHFSIYGRNYSSDPYGYTSSGGTTVSRSDSKIVMSYSSGNVTYYDPQYVVRNSGSLP